MRAHGTARRGQVTLHWESTGNGPPVLLIAGLGMSTTGWWRTVPVLARRFRVITFDNRGVGRSSPVPGIYTTEAMAHDATAVLDEAGVEAAHVYGVSLGGMVAQRLVLSAPDRVMSLILGATQSGAVVKRADADTVAFFRRRFLLPAEEAAWASVPYGYSPKCRSEHPERIAQDIEQRLRFPVEPRTYRAQMAAAVSHDCTHRLAQVTVPTLVVHGALDRMIPLPNGERLAQRLGNARLHVLPEAAHFYSTDEPRVDELISSFLEERS
jgi:pimeloyl-ACP methyl ester carboxylesterase